MPRIPVQVVKNPFQSAGFSRSLRSAEPLIELVIRLCGWSAILFVVAIFFFIFREAAPVLFGGLNLGEFFTSVNWQPTSLVRPQYGILALLAGSAAVTALAVAIAMPLGLGAAVYISEFAGGKSKEVLKIAVELLAAVPSVVWGFIGYVVLGPIIMKITGAAVGVNLLNGGVILALMSVPIIVSVGEDALKAVPDSYREAALAMGASRWEIVYRVLFPAAKNGLLAAVLLGLGRAIGETMAVLMATGNAVQIPRSLLGSHSHADGDNRLGVGRGRGRRHPLSGLVSHRRGVVRGNVHRQPDRRFGNQGISHRKRELSWNQLRKHPPRDLSMCFSSAPASKSQPHPRLRLPAWKKPCRPLHGISCNWQKWSIKKSARRYNVKSYAAGRVKACNQAKDRNTNSM